MSETPLGLVSTDDLPEELRAKVVTATADIPAHVDFFAVTETEKHYLPDDVQFFVLKVLNEGDRRRYLSKVNKEIKMNAQTKEMRMTGAAGEDTQALIEAATVDWYVFRDGKLLRFEQRTLSQVIEAFPPRIVLDIEEKIKTMNPWLRDEGDLDAMIAERDDLNQRIEAAQAKAAKN